jgi:type I restriction enzyme S subunit
MSTATTHIDNKLTLRGTKQSHPLVPELRFKEFEGQFQLKEFDEITDITRLAGYEYSKYWKEDEEQEIIALRGYNIGKGELNLRDLGYISNELSLQLKRSRLSIGDIVYPCVGTIGNAVVIEENDKFHIQQNIAKITCNDFASPYYVVQFLSSDYGLKEVYRFNASGAQPNVLVGSLRKYRINIPSLPEQQKIASFLSAVDEKIQQLTKKKGLLEDYKKGVMQQLFSGQLRFKDENGEAYPDWEEKIFSDLYSFHSTNSLSRDKLNYDAGSVYNIHYGDIHTKFKTAFNLNEAYIPFVNDDVDLSKIKTDSFCKKGDLVMADASEDYADIGKTIELIDLKDENVLAGLHTFLARPITSKTTIGFFSVLLKSWSMRKQIMVIAQGTKVLSLSTTRVGKLKLKLPVIEEQQKIATYLSSIDTKIEAVSNQITQTQTFKKGLLQQMFV